MQGLKFLEVGSILDYLSVKIPNKKKILQEAKLCSVSKRKIQIMLKLADTFQNKMFLINISHVFDFFA